MEDLVYRRPRTLNQFGTFPLAAGGALVMQLPTALYQLAAGVFAVPLAILAARERCTTVTAAGITVRTVRSRFIPWNQIDAITATPTADGDRAVDIRLADGSRLRLPEPVERHGRTRDPEFDEKYSAIIAAWLRSSAPAPADAGARFRPGG
ncbi:MAG: PH domain-containing protein [Catenulispora sp.]|nr:PH domain-containing protein [Catenulispora sp.]